MLPGWGNDMAEVWLVTNRKLVKNRCLVKKVESLCRRGIDGVILREKDLPTKELYHLAREIRAVTKQYGVKLIVNKSIETALAVEAEGIHLGSDALPLHNARLIVPAYMKIGVSVHSAEEAKTAAAERADYILAGNVYATASKPNLAGRGTAWLSRVVQTVYPLPVLAIGGINESNAGEVLKAGAAGVAAISGLLVNNNPGKLIEIIKGQRT